MTTGIQLLPRHQAPSGIPDEKRVVVANQLNLIIHGNAHHAVGAGIKHRVAAGSRIPVERAVVHIAVRPERHARTADNPAVGRMTVKITVVSFRAIRSENTVGNDNSAQNFACHICRFGDFARTRTMISSAFSRFPAAFNTVTAGRPGIGIRIGITAGRQMMLSVISLSGHHGRY